MLQPHVLHLKNVNAPVVPLLPAVRLGTIGNQQLVPQQKNVPDVAQLPEVL